MYSDESFKIHKKNPKFQLINSINDKKQNSNTLQSNKSNISSKVLNFNQNQNNNSYNESDCSKLRIFKSFSTINNKIFLNDLKVSKLRKNEMLNSNIKDDCGNNNSNLKLNSNYLNLLNNKSISSSFLMKNKDISKLKIFNFKKIQSISHIIDLLDFILKLLFLLLRLFDRSVDEFNSMSKKSKIYSIKCKIMRLIRGVKCKNCIILKRKFVLFKREIQYYCIKINKYNKLIIEFINMLNYSKKLKCKKNRKKNKKRLFFKKSFRMYKLFVKSKINSNFEKLKISKVKECSSNQIISNFFICNNNFVFKNMKTSYKKENLEGSLNLQRNNDEDFSELCIKFLLSIITHLVSFLLFYFSINFYILKKIESAINIIFQRNTNFNISIMKGDTHKIILKGIEFCNYKYRNNFVKNEIISENGKKLKSYVLMIVKTLFNILYFLMFFYFYFSFIILNYFFYI